MWIHHTIDKLPDENDLKNKYSWQKDHLENKTGTDERHKPIKIKKDNTEKKYETWKKISLFYVIYLILLEIYLLQRTK